MVRILIAGDVCPIGRNETVFAKGDAESIFGEMLREFSRVDISAVNLECPLISKQTPIQKSGPVLGVKDSCINAISKAGIDVVNLANNHIMDHGMEGMSNTIATCDRFSIAHVGAGENLQAAKEMLTRNVNGIRIAFYAAAEHEFSIATANSGGANPLNVIDFVRTVETGQDKWDYLIVLVHGGNEGYPYPNPFLRDVCRFFIEQGANAVICQHSHCPGCYETYHNGQIVYGQGNLCFDRVPYAGENWHEGFLVMLSVESNLDSEMNIIPYSQTEFGPGIRLMKGPKLEQFLQLLAERSEAVLDDRFIAKQWDQLCRDHKKRYLNTFLGSGSFAQRVAGRLGLTKCFWGKKSMMRKLNFIRCQSHRDILIKVLSDELKGL